VGAADVYAARLAERRDQKAALDRRHVRLSRLRLGFVGLMLLVPIAAGFDAIAWAAVPAALFLLTAVIHARTLDARRRAGFAVAFYERGLARLSHAWVGTGESGESFRDDAHPYAGDLDIFGRGGLFELLATTRTRAGHETLARWLLHPAGPDEVRARQEALRELATQIDLREAIAVLGDDLGVGVHADSLRAWAGAPIALGQTRVRILLAALALSIVSLTAWAIAIQGLTVVLLTLFIVVLVVEGLLALWLRPRVRPVITRLDRPTRDLELLSDVLSLVEHARFTSAKLQAVQTAFGRGARAASSEIRRLARLSALLESRRNVYFALPAAMLLWATQLAFAIEAWRARAGRHVPEWLAALGEFEALAALSAFSYERPGYAFPTIADPGGPRHFAAQALAHPLLPDAAVANDVCLGDAAPSLLIVSGSNMSGKSTFLRAIGVNVVLAQAGAPVRAASLRLSPLAVGASMRAADSLVDGRSRFMAEIMRLKQVVDLARAHEGRLLFLLDEVLSGTNSHDRRHGAQALLTGLVRLGAIGLVTTHDLALGAMADAPDVRAANVHFEDAFDGTHLAFDYRLKPGLVKTSNAIPLMQSIGLDV
jgi:hypothetical protein